MTSSMDTFLKAFPVQLIFRGVFPGGFFVLSYVVATKGQCELKIIGDDLLTLWFPLAIFSGVMVYILHRSIAYPIIECMFDCCSAKKKCVSLIKESTVKRLLKMWAIGKSDDSIKNRAVHLTGWHDYVHLQYTSGWCIMAGGIDKATSLL